MLLKGEQKSVFSRRPYIDSSRVQGRGLRSSTLSFLLLDFTGAIQITLVFVRRIKSGIVVLAVYVDDILLTGSDSVRLLETNKYPERHFVTKDMGRPKYFLRIEVVHQKHSILLSQEKYAVDILKEVGLLGASLLSL